MSEVRAPKRVPATRRSDRGRLRARPSTEPVSPADPRDLSGEPRPLGLAEGRDGLVYVPRSYAADRAAPLVLMLHGAGGNARHGLDPFLPLADDAGALLLAPDSRGRTWDVILGDYGPDVAFVDLALARVFERFAVDPSRIAVEGFSDGASYALSLGIGNGDLFSHVVAFSPGFAAPAGRRGAPRIYVAHGIHDQVLPIDACSRRIVPRLEEAGSDVRYHEFDGPHTVPVDIARDALAWFTESRPGATRSADRPTR